MEEGGVSISAAVIACTAMTFFYVAILYSPTLILRLPPPTSFKIFMIRRFICAAISSFVSLIACALILPIRRWDASSLFCAYGIRMDHMWEAVVLPLSLTSLIYAGSLVHKSLLLFNSWTEHWSQGRDLSTFCLKNVLQELISWMFSIASNVSAWRIYFVAPLTEELVFRACMIPLLLCGGFKTYTVILLSPVFFSLGSVPKQERTCLAASNCCYHPSTIMKPFSTTYAIIIKHFLQPPQSPADCHSL